MYVRVMLRGLPVVTQVTQEQLGLWEQRTDFRKEVWMYHQRQILTSREVKGMILALVLLRCPLRTLVNKLWSIDLIVIGFREKHWEIWHFEYELLLRNLAIKEKRELRLELEKSHLTFFGKNFPLLWKHLNVSVWS